MASKRILLLFMISLTANAATVEQRIIDLEIDKMLKKIKLSGELRAQGTYHNTQNTIKGHNHEDKVFHGGVDISANSEVTKKIAVYTTFQAGYTYGKDLNTPSVETGTKTEQLSGDRLKVIRAYVDWELVDEKLFLSIGRLSTIYGPPQHLYSNTERSGTYPLMAYSIPFDGVGLTYNLPSKSFQQKLRAVYGPQANPSDDPFLGNEIGGGIAKSSDLYTLIYELKNRKPFGIELPFIFIAQAYGGNLIADKSIEQRGALKTPGNSDNHIYSIYGDKDNLIGFRAVNGYLEVNSPFRFPIDIYGSFTRAWVKRKGSLVAELTTKYSTPTTLNEGDRVAIGGYLYNSNHVANKYLTGIRYRGENWSFGGEYLNSELGSLTASPYTKRVTDFYNAVGEGYHLYYSHKVTRRAVDLRFGYSNTLYSHELNGFTYAESRRRQENFYTLLTVRF